MLYREIIAVCSEIHTKHINTLCGQNVEFVNVKPGGRYSDHWALDGPLAGLHKCRTTVLKTPCTNPAQSIADGCSDVVRTAHWFMNKKSRTRGTVMAIVGNTWAPEAFNSSLRNYESDMSLHNNILCFSSALRHTGQSYTFRNTR